jgi:hypothetical protein
MNRTEVAVREDCGPNHEGLNLIDAQSTNAKQPVQKLGLNSSDTVYLGSEYSSLSVRRNDLYISKLAVDLWEIVKAYQSDREALARISELLPDLLKAFALKLGHKAESKANSQMHRDVSYFVHKYRRYVNFLRLSFVLNTMTFNRVLEASCI